MLNTNEEWLMGKADWDAKLLGTEGPWPVRGDFPASATALGPNGLSKAKNPNLWMEYFSFKTSAINSYI